MSTHEIASCFNKTFVAGLPALATAPIEGNDLLAQIRRAVLALLQELDDLPREHPVWRYMANQAVNQYRLAEYASRLLRTDPKHSGARWTRIAIGLVNGANEFPEDDWTVLLQSIEPFEVDWVIYDSLRRAFDWGDGTAVHAARFIDAHHLRSSGVAVLRLLESGDHSYARVLLGPLYDRKRVIGWAQAALNS